MGFQVYRNGEIADIFVEEDAFPGVRRVADTVADDIELVTGVRPRVCSSLETQGMPADGVSADRMPVDGVLADGMPTDRMPTDGVPGCDRNVRNENAHLPLRGRNVIFAATIGKSKTAGRFIEEGRLWLDGLYQETETAMGTEAAAEPEAAAGWQSQTRMLKREVYTIQLLEHPFPEHPEIESVLVVLGTDKRGTIYGLFRVSELCGISPLVYWGDALPQHRDSVNLAVDMPFFSKEPSVRYRGFFINDEWPAFGNWCMEHFGGVNAKAYKKIFELLLRLKGNYLWPAMWNSSFSEDGPGEENARLADEYGVIMGTSHHEPLCRAGVEWQRKYQQYGENSAWNFASNGEAITRFWEEGLKRNRKYENVITIGMRGENDSKLLSENATKKDNIEALKQAITVQHRLIREQVNPELSEVPRMLAIYKEVEDFYYGDETCEGLRHWDELKDVIFLLSDDNFGNLRALPDENDRKHPGGFGMYYHFDYHGAPVSYEWQNSIRLSKVWEQMTMAYDYGVRDMWIVNVGDLKGVEYPLSYFLDLAYDYEKWGAGKTDGNSECVYGQVSKDREKSCGQADGNSEYGYGQVSKDRENGWRCTAADYTKYWLDVQFGESVTAGQKQEIGEVLDGYIRWNSVRRPEVMNEHIYHPTHFHEAERVAKEAGILLAKAEQLHHELDGNALAAYDSMVYYPAAASLEMILMNLDAGQNHMLAARGSAAANCYAESAKKRIAAEQELIEEYHAMRDGKWNHMMRSAHTGFKSWDDHDWGYPVLHMVTPLPRAKVVTGFSGSDAYRLESHWQDGRPLCNTEFLNPKTESITVWVDSRGTVSFSYEIQCDKEWLEFSARTGRVNADVSGQAEFSGNGLFGMQGSGQMEFSDNGLFGMQGSSQAEFSDNVQVGKQSSLQNGSCAGDCLAASVNGNARAAIEIHCLRERLSGEEEAKLEFLFTFDNGERQRVVLAVRAAGKAAPGSVQTVTGESRQIPAKADFPECGGSIAEIEGKSGQISTKTDFPEDRGSMQETDENSRKVLEETELPESGIQENNIAEKEICFMEYGGIIAIDAEHFCKRHDVCGGFRIVPGLGRTAAGLKCFPVTKDWSAEAEKPSAEYVFLARQEGTYRLEFYFVPRNPVQLGKQMRFSFAVNGGKAQEMAAVPADYYTEWQCAAWNSGVMNNVRIVRTETELMAGENRLKFYAGEPGVILERIVLCRKEIPEQESYLGPEESPAGGNGMFKKES